MTEILDEDTIALARQLRDKRAETAKSKRDENDLRIALLERLQKLKTDRGVTASGTPVAHITVAYRTQVDAKKLEAKYPDTYAECSDQKPTVTLHIDIVD